MAKNGKSKVSSNSGKSVETAVGLEAILESLATLPGREGKTTLSVKKGETTKYTLGTKEAVVISDECDDVARGFSHVGGTVGKKSKYGSADKNASMTISGAEAARLAYVIGNEAETMEGADALCVAAGVLISAEKRKTQNVLKITDTLVASVEGMADFVHVKPADVLKVARFIAEKVEEGDLPLDKAGEEFGALLLSKYPAGKKRVETADNGEPAKV